MNFKKVYIISALLVLIALGLGAEYYQDVEDLTGDELLYGLRDLISTNTYSSYDGAKVFLFQELDNDDGVVVCIYTGQEYTIDENYSGQNNPNTEHTYAQSWFSDPDSNIKKADLHHLFITTMNVNSARGNLPFGNVASTAASTVYYSYTPLQSYRGNDNWQHMVFQVNSQYQGDIARAILYFHTRYEDPLVQGGVDMLPTMITWHYADPPDEAERDRNDMIYSFQNNRNPFVDRPEFVNRIWNPGVIVADDFNAAVPALRIDSVYPNPFSDEVRVSVDAKDNQRLTATIYNVRGEKVRDIKLDSAQKSFIWDGCDSTGRRQSSGVYFVRIKGQHASASQKLLLLD
nr:hypothetical protein [Candidatus Cloacimonadota bacterium]